MPLLKYEAEIFVQTGAWKSILELEESITLEELFVLYRACSNEFTKQIKISSMAWGGEVDFDDDWYDPEPPRAAQVHDILDMKFGMGYETVKKGE